MLEEQRRGKEFGRGETALHSQRLLPGGSFYFVSLQMERARGPAPKLLSRRRRCKSCCRAAKVLVIKGLCQVGKASARGDLSFRLNAPSGGDTPLRGENNTLST